MSLLFELARRAVSHPHTATFVKRAVAAQHGEGERIEIPTWGFVLLQLSLWASIVFIALTSYMLNEVVTTLCMVESPTAAITVSPSTHEASDKEDSDEKETLLETGPTITLVSQKPITSSIRATIRHVVSHGGRLARFRGFGTHILYSVLASIVATFFNAALPTFPCQPILAAGIAGVLLANLHAAWTHKVVGMPTKASLWQRIPSKTHWKTLALPAAMQTAMPYISLYLTCGVAMLLRLNKLEQETIESCAQWMGLIARFIALFVFAITCTLFLCLPAMVTLIRIEASILPEDQDTIVPFDRTFGGKVVSKMMGGSGVVGFLDAWRSFNWEARRRLFKTLAKTFLIMTAIMLVVVHVLLFEVFAIFGPAVGQFLAQVQRVQQEQLGNQ